VKLIPPGTHFVFFALKDEEYASKMGFFIHIPSLKDLKDDIKQLVIVRKWDNNLQRFIKLPEADECAYQEGVMNFDFDRNLGAYPLQTLHIWQSLSNYITLDVIQRLQPINPIILSE
jgi:hypothetical protein